MIRIIMLSGTGTLSVEAGTVLATWGGSILPNYVIVIRFSRYLYFYHSIHFVEGLEAEASFIMFRQISRVLVARQIHAPVQVQWYTRLRSLRLHRT